MEWLEDNTGQQDSKHSLTEECSVDAETYLYTLVAWVLKCSHVEDEANGIVRQRYRLSSY